MSSLIVFLVLCFAGTASATSVTAIALFQDRAMLSIDGGKAKIIKAGSTYKGVKVVSSSTSGAVIEVAGKRQDLRLNGTANIDGVLGGASNTEATSVVLYVDENGFFESNGSVNGRSIRFLVDTGANIVVLNSVQAERLNIDYRAGQVGYASTASGRAPMYTVTLDEISIGGISLKNIETGVIEGSFPEKPLLGMTFLRKLDMTRSGGTMVLKKR